MIGTVLLNWHCNKWEIELNWIYWTEIEVIYEGWNFNSGNYLFTTDTK